MDLLLTKNPYSVRQGTTVYDLDFVNSNMYWSLVCGQNVILQITFHYPKPCHHGIGVAIPCMRWLTSCQYIIMLDAQQLLQGVDISWASIYPDRVFNFRPLVTKPRCLSDAERYIFAFLPLGNISSTLEHCSPNHKPLNLQKDSSCNLKRNYRYWNWVA